MIIILPSFNNPVPLETRSYAQIQLALDELFEENAKQD